MLKFILFNKKKIPVPVPIHTLGEALHWLEETLVSKDHAITKVELDGEEIDLASNSSEKFRTSLSTRSKLVVQVDSPRELAVQTIDALRNLDSLIRNSLKQIAVTAWQTPAKAHPQGLDTLQRDLELVLDLLDHLLVLTDDQRLNIVNVDNCAQAIAKAKLALNMAASDSDWKGAAKIILNQLEPRFDELCEELSFLQKTIFELQVTKPTFS